MSLPPHHLVLLSPAERNDWYSANPAYARALADEVLPAVRAELGGDAPVVALGASLGGLALLHAQRRVPGLFGGMFLQSGSFFQQRFDAQESGFAHYRRIIRFVAGVRRTPAGGGRCRRSSPAARARRTWPTTATWRRSCAGRATRCGWVEVPDAHNLVAWRDAWHPHLAELARQVWTDDRAPAQDA